METTESIDEELIRMLTQLTPEQSEAVKEFIKGMKLEKTAKK